jgi:magnesium transporter
VPIVDSAVYAGGRPVARPSTLAETYQLLRECSGLAWIGLYRPNEGEFASLAEEFGLHPLAVEDAVEAHQRPKLERYGDTLFVVIRPARYLDDIEEVEFSELHVFVGPGFVLTVRQGETPDLRLVRARLEREPALLALGPEAVLYAVLDRVVDDYLPIVDGLENDIEEIEVQVFGRSPNVSQRIYELSREVIEFQRAVRPLQTVAGALAAGFDKYDINVELRRLLRDVQDHLARVVDRLDGFRTLLTAALTVDATLVAQAQNEEMKRMTEVSLQQNEQVKRISAWAAILFAPTLVGTVYGMNFTHMPELSWLLGYPFALILMVLVCGGLYLSFKRRGWL